MSGEYRRRRRYHLNDETFESQAFELADAGLSRADQVILKEDIRNLRWAFKECRAHGFFKNVRQFWHKHHKAILIIAAITAVAVVVAVVAGAVAGAAAAAGGAAVQPNQKDKDDKDKHTTASAESASVEPVNENRPIVIDPSTSIPKDNNDPGKSILDALEQTAPVESNIDKNRPNGETHPMPETILPASSVPVKETPFAQTPIEMIPHSESVSQHKPELPRELPRIGSEDQSVIYIHCGINNVPSTVNTSGTTLYSQLNEAYAIQPDLTHNGGMIQGLSTVLLEKISQPSPANILIQGPVLSAIEREFLDNAQVQESIHTRATEMAIIAEQIINDNNPNLKQVHVAFSNGGYVLKEALKQLPSEYQQTVVAITAGTTAVIDNDLACKVYNLIGTKDWPSKICNGGEVGIEHASETAKIVPVKQTETQFLIGGHYFTQPEYLKEIAKTITSMIAGEYEISK